MPGFKGLPLHPSIVHFAIAGAFFAAGAVALATFWSDHRRPALTASILILSATVAGALAAAFTGWLWADKLAYLAGGWGPIPGPKAVGGLAQKHALLALAFLASSVTALLLALRARHKEGSIVLALLAALLACVLVAATGHIGGTMVHAPPLPDEELPTLSPK